MANNSDVRLGAVSSTLVAFLMLITKSDSDLIMDRIKVSGLYYSTRRGGEAAWEDR